MTTSSRAPTLVLFASASKKKLRTITNAIFLSRPSAGASIYIPPDCVIPDLIIYVAVQNLTGLLVGSLRFYVIASGIARYWGRGAPHLLPHSPLSSLSNWNPSSKRLTRSALYVQWFIGYYELKISGSARRIWITHGTVTSLNSIIAVCAVSVYV